MAAAACGFFAVAVITMTSLSRPGVADTCLASCWGVCERLSACWTVVARVSDFTFATSLTISGASAFEVPPGSVVVTKLTRGLTCTVTWAVYAAGLTRT